MYARIALVVAMAAGTSSRADAAQRCAFSPSAWSVAEGRALPLERVDLPRADLDETLVGPWGCTPCEEDQVEVSLSTGLSARLCHAIAEPVRAALERALAEGARVESLLGYRPSRSRGDPDATGLRTGWSHHAFGVALDVNAAHNGLYGSCTSWGPGCALLRGGPWDPAHPLSLTAAHPVVRELAAAGLRWGGTLDGVQKDFMHFSPDGG